MPYKNPEDLKKRNQRYYKKNKEKILAQQAEYREANPEKRKEAVSNWYYSNKDKSNALSAKRRSQKLNATPLWFEKESVEGVYAMAKWLNDTTWNEYEVDHIIPLQGKDVCGLHCRDNLQILTKEDNLRKGNRYEDSLGI